MQLAFQAGLAVPDLVYLTQLLLEQAAKLPAGSEWAIEACEQAGVAAMGAGDKLAELANLPAEKLAELKAAGERVMRGEL